MNTSKINDLKNRATNIKNAAEEGENSAEKVGQLLYDMVDYDADQSAAIDNLETKATDLQNQIDTIESGGGGGGSGSTGKEKMYFLNRTHSSTSPTKPSINDYSSSTDSFVVNGEWWTSYNTNPSSNQDTWAIWVWFTNVTTPSTIDGPVRIYNSASGGGSGSNGEDGEEVEFIYCRSTSEFDPTTKANLSTALASFTNEGSRVTSDVNIGGIVWSNHPKGVEENIRFEYTALRHSSLNSSGKRIWTSGFSGPYLWSAYGEKGADGDGVEYIFYASQDGTTPTGINRPQDWNDYTTGKYSSELGRNLTFQDNEFIALNSDWEDEPIDLENGNYGQGTIEFVSIRKKQEDRWQSFSAPKAWSRYAKDGIVDGYTVEFVNNNMPVNTDENGNVTEYSNEGWVQVFHNSTPLDYADSVDNTHFTYTIGTITRSDGGSVTGFSAFKNNTDKTQVDVTVSDVEGFKGVNAYIPIVVSLPNGTTRKLRCTLYGVISGEFVDLYVSAKVIRTNYEKTQVTPTSLDVGVILGKRTYLSMSEGGVESAEALGYTFTYAYDNRFEIANTGSIPLEANHSSITVTMYRDGEFLDSEYLSYISDGGPGGPGRGIQRIESHYRAVAVKQAPQDMGSSDPTDPADTQWGEDYPYLYCKDYVIYTNGDTGWNDPYLKDTWIQPESLIYELIPNPTSAKFSVDPISNKLTPLNIAIKCVIRKNVGNTFEETAPKSSDNKYGIYYAVNDTSGIEGNISEYTETLVNTGIIVTREENITSVNFYLAENYEGGEFTNLIRKISVPVIKDGLKDESAGTVGRFYYFGGDFDYNPTLVVDDYQAPYVQRGGKYYMYIGTDSVIDTSDPNKNPGGSNSSAYWKEIKYEQYFISDALFSKYAHVGGAIINRDWIISQYGTINGSMANPSIAYTTFDPIAFMNYLKPEIGASIGVITRSEGTNSQIFKVKGAAIVKVKGNGQTWLAKFKDNDYFKLDNSGKLYADDYVQYSHSGTTIWTINNNTYTNIELSEGTYCFMQGNVSDIKISYTDSTLTANVYVPNFALDLRSGFTYQNNTYINGVVKASLMYSAVKEIVTPAPQTGAITTSYTIDPEEEPYYTYFLVNTVPNDTLTITLPNPISYDGLELRFFVPKVSRNVGNVDLYQSNGIHYLDTTGYIVSADTVQLVYNQFITVKAMTNTWYVVSGVVL